MPIDPRTHIAVLLAASLFVMLARGAVQLHILVALSALYLTGNRLLRQAVYGVLAYAAMTALMSVAARHAVTFGIILYTFIRMMPVVMIGAALTGSAPGRMMCALERARVPKPLLVMLCILFRFFPVLLAEMQAIRDGIRARGIFPRWDSALRRPTLLYECFFVPLVVRCLKLSSELAASAELRGIECTRRRTSIQPVGLKAIDGLAAGLYALLAAAGLYATGGLLL